jgi:DNA mismatch endonuclease (patch repair protein)
MSHVRSRDTKPEIALRRAVHAKGGRFRLQARDVPGRPDLVVRARKVAVFIDGDLWHGNPEEWRRRGHDSLASMFPTRTEWWVSKIERNIARDKEVNQQLAEQGWRVLRIWASDVLRDRDQAASRVLALLRERP